MGVRGSVCSREQERGTHTLRVRQRKQERKSESVQRQKKEGGKSERDSALFSVWGGCDE